MGKFILILFLLIFYFLSNTFAQEVELTIGRRFESSNSTIVRTDSVIFYEDIPNNRYLPLGAMFRVPVKGRVDFNIGALYYNAVSGYAAYTKDTCDLCPTIKATTVTHPTIEFPLLAVYRVFMHRKWEANVQAGISPSIRLKIRGTKQTANPPDFDPKLADILNAAPNTVRGAYFNYRYGIQIRYDRIGIEAFWQQNLGRGVGKPLQVWEENYPFAKRIGSFSLHLSYTLFRWNKKVE